MHVPVVGSGGPGQEDIDRSRPAPLEQPLHLVGPARGQGPHVVELAHRVVRPVGVGRQRLEARLRARGIDLDGQAVPADGRHRDHRTAGQARWRSLRRRFPRPAAPPPRPALRSSRCPVRPPCPLPLFGHPGDECAWSSGQVWLDPHVAVPHSQGQRSGGVGLVWRQLHDDSTGPGQPIQGLQQEFLHVGQPRCAVARRPGHQGPHAVRCAPPDRVRATPPRSRRAGWPRPDRRRRAARRAGACNQSLSSSVTGGQATAARARTADRLAAATAERVGDWRRRPTPRTRSHGRAPRPARGRWPPTPYRRRPPPVPRRPARCRASRSATSTTCSVSGRGMSTRGSTSRSRERNGQWPKTYCSGSPATPAGSPWPGPPRPPPGRAGRWAHRAGRGRAPDRAPRPPRSAPRGVHRAPAASSATSAPRVTPAAASAEAAPPPRRHQPASSCPPSWRPRLSAMRASVSSTRSPASTWSNL